MHNSILVAADEAADILSVEDIKLVELTYEGKLPICTVAGQLRYSLEGLATWARAQAIDHSALEQTEHFFGHLELALTEDSRAILS